MSVFPSHSLWSSIKIPFSMYAGRKKKETVPSVPYVDFCYKMNQKNSGKPLKEITYLRVPNFLRKGKESSIPEIFCVFSMKKKQHRQKLPQKIKFFKMPHFNEEPKTNVREFYTNPNYEKRKYENLNLEEKFLELGCTGGKEEFPGVPFIKPWTLEELNEFHQRYGMENGQVTKIAENKNKGREITTEYAHNISNLANKILNVKTTASEKSVNSKFNEDFDFDDSEFYDCEQDPAALESDLNSKTGSKYTTSVTEPKLAELYMLEFDIKGY